MKKKFEFIKLYIKGSKKNYIYHSIELVIFCFIFHLVFYNIWNIKEIKQTLDVVGASELYQADFRVDDVNRLKYKLEDLKEELPYGIKIIDPSKTIAFTNQMHGNKQITVNFLSKNEIEQYKYSVSRGEYFGNELYSAKIYPAIIPEELNSRYEIGKVYDITIKKNLRTFQSIKIKIIGSRNNNYILDLAYSSANVYERNTTILIYDQVGEISSHFYAVFDDSISILFKKADYFSENNFISLLEEHGLENIRNLEKSILRVNGLTYKDIYIYITLIIVIIPLIIISLVSFYYLEFQNKKRELYIYTSYGLNQSFYSQSTFIINLIFFILPILVQEIIWFLICLIMNLKFIWFHSVLVMGICFFISLLITLFSPYFLSKLKYDDKILDEEIVCDEEPTK
ncbi:hypothetical protein [Paenibacillus thiaminolyticus]|uniref:hypothetical protein n=1 Tax=Paenibacillus thiaminolyticus TaxID=49283 RepID=UPI002543B4CC|nr:hypothetical protein [Paenibacillus thiaminolyticus]WII38499.1 hypothetical protein O0V01_05040 [Paenibacillus thiaminolyticus]